MESVKVQRFGGFRCRVQPFGAVWACCVFHGLRLLRSASPVATFVRPVGAKRLCGLVAGMLEQVKSCLVVECVLPWIPACAGMTERRGNDGKARG
jgi:hypothetical protein